MMNLEGRKTRLRALEPSDIDLMYAWENNTEIWKVSGTLTPFSRHMLERFLDEQQFDIYQTRQQRMVVERISDGKPIGAIDLFELDPVSRRAGLGILIHDPEDRGKGYASDAIKLLCEYALRVLNMHQIWCNIIAENTSCIRMFRALGFTEIGVKRDWQWRPDGFHDEVMMQKVLGE